MPIVVDSNVILDLVTRDPQWGRWSQDALERFSDDGLLANEIVYAELCASAESPDEVDALLESLGITLSIVPRNALFLAAKAHLAYRRRGGTRRSGLPDFFIGAHAEAERLPLLTRDARRYRHYFPTVELITPESS